MTVEPSDDHDLRVTAPERVRVAVLADVALFRQGLAGILAGRPDVEVVAAEAPTPDGLARLGVRSPNVVLVDATSISASDLAAHLTGLLPAAKVVAFGIVEDDERETLACAEAGVAGFVGRGGTEDDLVAALRSAVNGEIWCPPRTAALVFRRVARLAVASVAAPNPSRLTQRETEIVLLIEGGLSNKEIARRLGIEVSTVKNHVHNLLEKLNVHRRAQAVAIMRSERRWSRPPRRPSSAMYPRI